MEILLVSALILQSLVVGSLIYEIVQLKTLENYSKEILDGVANLEEEI